MKRSEYTSKVTAAEGWPNILEPAVAKHPPPQPAATGCCEGRRAGLLAFDVSLEFGK